jgi:quinol monooxygenase YgiN
MFTTFKRWALKDGFREEQVAALVREAILPAYQRLPGCLGIQLLRIEDTQSYLATQQWESRAARDEAISSETYAAWWSAYLPVLEKWDEMMEFEEEWETTELVG